MVKLLVAGVLVVITGVAIARMTSSQSTPTDPVEAQTQVDTARQKINDAMSTEGQRATDLNNLGSEPSNP